MTLKSDELSALYGYRFLDLEVIAELKRLASELKKEKAVVVNLGAGFGTSALAFLEAREDLRVITIDCQEDPTDIGSLSDERQSLERAGFLGDPRYEQILGYSAEIGKDWDRGKVDMVFVDASHSYEAVKRDALVWMPNIKRGGVIAFHDYWHAFDYGVIEAVDEVMKGYEVISKVSNMIVFRIKKATKEKKF